MASLAILSSTMELPACLATAGSQLAAGRGFTGCTNKTATQPRIFIGVLRILGNPWVPCEGLLLGDIGPHGAFSGLYWRYFRLEQQEVKISMAPITGSAMLAV